MEASVVVPEMHTLLQISCKHFQVVVFWVVTTCRDVVGYQCFGRPCCLHLHSPW